MQPYFRRAPGPGEIQIFDYVGNPNRFFLLPNCSGQSDSGPENKITTDFLKFNCVRTLGLPGLGATQDISAPIYGPQRSILPTQTVTDCFQYLRRSFVDGVGFS